jgi:hypothetical protein
LSTKNESDRKLLSQHFHGHFQGAKTVVTSPKLSARTSNANIPEVLAGGANQIPTSKATFLMNHKNHLLKPTKVNSQANLKKTQAKHKKSFSLMNQRIAEMLLAIS